MPFDGFGLQDWARLIRLASYTSYRATLVGNPAPCVRQLYDYMQDIKIGSFVFESSTVHYRTRDLDAVGVLECIAWEKVDFGEGFEGWDEEEEGRPHPTEKVFYIRTLDDRRFRWHNAEMLRVPDDLDAMTASWKGRSAK